MNLQGSKAEAVRSLGTKTQNLYQSRGPHHSKDYLDDAGSESDFGIGQASAEEDTPKNWLERPFQTARLLNRRPGSSGVPVNSMPASSKARFRSRSV